MDDFSNSVMIALLPINSDWSKVDLPHMTLIFAGTTDDLSPNAFNELGKDAASIAMVSQVITVRVLGIQIFGDEEKVDALKLQTTPELRSMRRFVERWNVSKHPFNPHVTIGPTGTFVEHIPGFVAFDRIMVGWGNEQLVFWLKRY